MDSARTAGLYSKDLSRDEGRPMTAQARTSRSTAWVVALTAIGSLMAALDTLVVSTSLSTIRLDLGASIEDLEWTVNAYNLSSPCS